MTIVMPGPIVTENLRVVSSSSEPPLDFVVPSPSLELGMATALEEAHVASSRHSVVAVEDTLGPVVLDGIDEGLAVNTGGGAAERLIEAVAVAVGEAAEGPAAGGRLDDDWSGGCASQGVTLAQRACA
eukprot:CAMPEP_0205923884 /NCGR_PEP_ID=MMETSP1325-20131115/16652_1 /ASSEMBLY_ACC=CAM_ASM_000708 /TAXON_ID=236786 /ORGANISM="Florenciella sp., Strain RCC1007" /LENGTH=127 /DNA_ID=CAMNT_0053292159 /DNA_START=721 /DNA_END=1105 /DNA_ORIENTATION=-